MNMASLLNRCCNSSVNMTLSNSCFLFREMICSSRNSTTNHHPSKVEIAHSFQEDECYRVIPSSTAGCCDHSLHRYIGVATGNGQDKPEISHFQKSSKIEIPNNVAICGSNCFSSCKSLSSITFESNSHLTRIESCAFYGSLLQSILIPNNVQILGSNCFSSCKSLSSITFESNSHLT
jgi:hypothetical protein